MNLGGTLPKNNHLRTALRALSLAAAYFVTGWFGLQLPAVGSHVTLLWLPTGIAVAGLLRCGNGCWPGVALGAFLVNFATGIPWRVAAGITVGSTLGPLLAAWALRRMGIHPAFDRKRDILLLAAGGALGMLLSASIGVANLSLSGMLPDDRLAAWLTWWAGDTMGVIAAAPLLLAFARRQWRGIVVRRWEFLSWLGVTFLTAWGVFVLNRGPNGQPWALAFVPLSTVAWAALRFGSIGTSLTLILLPAIAAYGTATGRGPFHRAEPIEQVVVLWIFMATSALLGWVITALHFARLRAVGIQTLFERALSDASLGMLLAGHDRRITFANAGFTRLTGYTEAELLGKSCAILQGPETDPATVERLKTALHGDGYFDGEILNYRKDGTIFWNALLVSPVRDDDGVMTGFLGIQRDITERKMAEMALTDSRSRLDSILNSMEDVVWSSTPDGQALNFLSVAVEAMYGRPASEFIADPLKWVAMIHPEDREAVVRAFQRVPEMGEFDAEYRIVRDDGAVRWVHDRGRIVNDAGGKPLRMDGIVTDITGRKLGEAALRESEERFRKIIEHAPEAIQLLDMTTGRFLLVSDASERLFKRSIDELLRSGPMELSPPMQPDGRPSAEKGMEFLKQAMAGEKPVFEWMHRDAEGCDIPCEVRLLRMEIGGHAVVRGSVTDISARKLAERRLRDSEARYRTLFQANPHPMWAYDLETLRFLAVNAAAVTHYGYSEEEFLAMTIKDIRPPGDVPSLLANVAAVTGGLEEAGVWRHRKRDGSLIDVEITSHGMDFDGRRAEVVLAHDVTERRRAKTEREQLARKMQETQKLESLGVLAGGIAHDFNNILTAILGNASLALYEVAPGSSVHECLDQVSQAALRAADLCKQMLAYSGRGRFVVRRIDLGELIGEIAPMLQISISKKAVLRLSAGKDVPPMEADATQLRQVIMNLVINASDAIGDKGGVIDVTTGVVRVDRAYLAAAMMPYGLPEGEYVSLEVSDDGCGMDEEVQAKIFDPFFTTKFAGRGLGLAAVLGIVRGHGGAMKVSSERGRGSTFRLLFPAASGPVEAAPEEPAVSSHWRGHGTVLVVDDEPSIRSTVAQMLTHMGMESVLAADGREGLEVFRADPGRFVLVLLDLTMPHMDGAETFAGMRSLRGDVPVVLMSGFNEQEALVRFAGKGLASFIQKPFSSDSLRTAIRGVLG